MHITTEYANDILVRVCLGFWRVFSGGRSKKPGHLRLSGHCSRPRVPCDRKPRIEVKEVWVGEGERRKRYVLCCNPAEAEQQRAHRAQVLAELSAELSLLREREADHPKAACDLLASRRYGRYLTADYTGRPRLDAAKVKAAEKFD